MKNFKRIRLFVILVSTIITLNSCLKDDVKDLISSDEVESALSFMGFEFLLINEFEINIEYLDNLNQPVDGVYVEIYSENPLDEYGILTGYIIREYNENKKTFHEKRYCCRYFKCREFFPCKVEHAVDKAPEYKVPGSPVP